MKKSLKILAVVTAVMLSACNTYSNEADWSNTLPSASAKTGNGAAAEIITEESAEPISIKMPEKTEPSSSKETELATTTETEVPETTTTTPENTITDIPTVPVSEYNPAIPVTTPPTTVSEREEPLPVSSHDSVLSAGSETVSSVTEETTAAEVPYVFNDPISRPYCYGTLSEKKRSLYDIIIKGILEHKDKVSIPEELEISKQDYEDVYQMIYNNEHSIYYISTRMRYGRDMSTDRVVSADLYYIYTQDEINSMQKKIDAAADKIISEITEEMTEYDIVKLFFDRLVEGCVYDINADNCRDIYGCLAVGRGVCGGYAKAFSYLCDKVGIPSLTITGDFENVPHMWNMVKIEGEWYHIDVTSGYVDNSAVKYIRYDYFCVDDAKIRRAHSIYEQSYDYPTASALKYNYYVYNGLVADSYEKAYEMLVEELVSAASKGENIIQIQCADDETFSNAVYELFSPNAKALNIYDDAYDRAERKYNRESIVYNQDSTTGVIKLFIEYLD